MTALLGPATRRPGAPSGGDLRRRSLSLGAAVAGLVSAGTVLLCCMVLGLVGWFASDAGGHGDTIDALRLGADAWLLAHGSALDLGAVTVSAKPLGLTVLCGYVAFRAGRRTGGTCVVDDDRTLLLGATVLTGVYAVLASLTAMLASTEQARTQPGVAFLGGALVALVGGGSGLVVGSGRGASLRRRLPEPVVVVGLGAAGCALLMLAAGCVALLAALVVDFGTAANVLSRLHPGAAGGLLYTLVVAAVVPNAALFAGSYLAGPGFAVGTGTLVSPSAVVLGPVPAFPLLAALPAESGAAAAPYWPMWLVGVPVLVAAAAAHLALRRHPVGRYDVAALYGLLSGALGGVAFTGLAVLAGGSVGPGRMADVHVMAAETLLWSAAAMATGGLVAGLGHAWRARRARPA